MFVYKVTWLPKIQQDTCGLWDKSAKLCVHNWGMVNQFLWYIMNAVAAPHCLALDEQEERRSKICLGIHIGLVNKKFRKMNIFCDSFLLKSLFVFSSSSSMGLTVATDTKYKSVIEKFNGHSRFGGTSDL